ncbi:MULTISPECIES: lysine N(6)-hydroxylase/L-ornithine N(5)-oxygenase family protein [unclassified Staphylococcus]|uniref:lysine N(6)-hydroxylase/L-ornithine N(5)-oxygenase family protein n=1 Tax=unclassified Staphylococcus TaxID=91994 RepID=UPI0021D10EFB|nr:MULTISPECIES: lysine N(6)-hydroxylase/L-ornithine N(5)-oxygenase family protein [unclassified Staphylococcus]UXR78168.1 lysine N(6)-hydroxylase/L-ornithine N(5)-oxygenase family protein [Staphylococcus sp. IVB6227]UXR82331.1 lysine N(6)-hydroxylase/L-ornithine N(5)-oxygenase family protein [Staphylococcus sp. IVB6214]
MYEWIIIGGGVHATTLALQLRYSGLPGEQLAIIDSHDELMGNFKMQTSRLSMPYLRSPLVHHCYPEAFDLKKFAKQQQYTQAMIGQFQRPRLDMFLDHTEKWIHHYALDKAHIHQESVNIQQKDQYWEVTLNNGEQVQGHYVVLAMGTHHTPNIPDLYVEQPDVQHIHQKDFDASITSSHVVGNGISAAHLVIKLLSEERSEPIHLWLKKPLEVFDFDAEPGWLGPKYMRCFQCEKDLAKRAEINRQERHKGSMPKEMHLKLRHAQEEGKLIIHQTPIVKVADHMIHTEDQVIPYDGIYLATGFKFDLMEQPLIQSILNREDADVVSGFPVITSTLEWVPNLYVTGMLADLELGPFARSITGGRMAAQRISEVFLNDQQNMKNVI